jgi:O-antigen ligase
MMENFRMKPHNQYLLFLLTLGIIGSVMIYSLYAFFVLKTMAYRYWPFNVFLVIMTISMLANHPIDSQAGQTFFTFFTLYFGFIYPSAKRC